MDECIECGSPLEGGDYNCTEHEGCEMCEYCCSEVTENETRAIRGGDDMTNDPNDRNSLSQEMFQKDFDAMTEAERELHKAESDRRVESGMYLETELPCQSNADEEPKEVLDINE